MRKIHLFLIISGFLIMLPHGTYAATVAYDWNSVIVGGGGFVTGIVYHPGVPGLAYARTDMGGAYRRDTTGGNWIAITDFLDRNNSDYMGILSIAPDPSDANRVYAMTGKYTASWAGNGAVLTSANKGATWTIVPLSFKVGGNEDGRGAGERLVVDPNLGSILFMGSGGANAAAGLWKSTNYGASWTQVGSFSTTANINYVIFDKSSSASGTATQRIFVGVNNTGGQSLWISTNGGTSWAVVAGQPNGQMTLRADIAGTAPRYLYTTWSNNAGPNNATAGGVWRYNITTPGWTNISPVVNPAYGYGGISVDAQNPQHIMVSTLDLWWPMDQVWRSTNGGTSWTALMWNTATNAMIAALNNSYAPWSAIRNPHWLADIKIDPFNSARAEFGTGYGIFSCDNVAAAATTWYFRNGIFEEMVPLEIVSPPSGTLLLSACGDQGVFKHDVLTSSPAAGVAYNVGTSLSIDYAELLPSKIVAAYNSPSPFGGYSTNSGAGWTNFAAAPAGTSGGGSKCIAISANGNNIMWSPPGAACSYSTNNGGSWTACGGGVPAGWQPESDRVNSNKFYVYNPVAGRLWYTTTTPGTFTQSATVYPTLPDYNAAGGTVSAVFGREGDIWITTGAGGLYHSTDSGATGTKVNSVTEAYAIGFGRASGAYPAIYLHGIVGGVLGIFRSDDTGATWSRINDDSHQFGYLHNIKGDKNVYGRCFISAEGRGISYGVPAGAATPTFTPTRTPATTATYTRTRTATGTFTRTNTPVNTMTYTRTATATSTRTQTPANTATFTTTATGTFTRTATPVNTTTYTRTATATSTRTQTPANTATFTTTATGTFTRTATPVNTTTYTRTATATSTRTQTPANTATFTTTATGTFTRTATPVNTTTYTRTATATATRTQTPANTATFTTTATGTFTRTATPVNTTTYTRTATATSTRTQTPANTATFTTTATGTFTRTATPVNTTTYTRTATATATRTQTPANTATFTTTATGTFTRTATPVNTITSTGTAAGTYTRTQTPLNTATFTSTAIGTFTGTATPVNTFTRTATSMGTGTRTMTVTQTYSRTATISPTWTEGFGTLTNTPTATQTGTKTASPDNTATMTVTSSRTITATYTATPGATFTMTSSMTYTLTLTAVNTPTYTFTGIPTHTSTATNTIAAPTLTFTRTNTVIVPSVTFTGTQANTPSRTATMTVISTASATPTFTSSPDHSQTQSPTGTPPTSTETVTITRTSTVLPTDTITATYTFTAVPTHTHTADRTPTDTAVNTPSRTSTPQNTMTSSASATITAAATSTATRFASFTATGTFTRTVTRTPIPVSPTQTATSTPAEGPDEGFRISDLIIFPNPYSGRNGLRMSFYVTKPADRITVNLYTASYRKVVQREQSGPFTRGSTAALDDRVFSRLANGVYYAVLTAASGNERAASKPVELVILR